MQVPPAIALLEFESIAVGTTAADAMVKKAPLDAFRAGTVQPGKYIVLVGGSVAAVEESYREGLRVGAEALSDESFLPDVHKQVYDAAGGRRLAGEGEALGLVETSSIPSNVVAADKAVKAAEVTIVEMRLGDGLGGKGITHFVGRLHQVQAAMEAAVAAVTRPGVTLRQTIIPSLDGWVRNRLAATTEFHR